LPSSAHKSALRGDALLQASERLLSSGELFRRLPQRVALLDENRTLLYLSQTIVGVDPSEVLGLDAADLAAPESRGAYIAAFARAVTEGVTTSIECESVNGSIWRTSFEPIETPEGLLVLAVGTETTEQRRTEKALRESETRLRYAVQATGLGTWTWDQRDNLVVWDEGLCRIFDLDPVKAPPTYETYLKHVHPEDQEHVMKRVASTLETGIPQDLVHRIIRPSGEVRHIMCRAMTYQEADGKSVGLRGGVFDVTERRRLEEQLRQAQKMEAVGQLTAGIAHNFNNLLSIILPNVEQVRDAVGPEQSIKLAHVEHAAWRAAELVRQLMLFSRRDSGERVPSDVASLTHRAVTICRSTFDTRIIIELQEEPDLPWALARAGDIEQVLLNLCLNARDALESARTLEPAISIRLETGSNGMVRIRVRDNGPGIPAHHREHIYEPFFTTKEVGQGTGLGLATVYALVTEHGGNILLNTEIGHGTEFVVELPTTPAPTPASSPEKDSAPEPCCEGTLLLVDDEPLVRQALRDLLSFAGFRVREAEDGRSAWAMLQAEGDEAFDLVLLDGSMPHMGGHELLQTIRRAGFEVPIVLLTGHLQADHETSGADAVLLKPPDRKTLMNTLCKVLQGRETRGGAAQKAAVR